MTPFFFITCYDSISAYVIASMVNAFDKLECTTINDDLLLPTACKLPIDAFIKKHQTDHNKVQGNIYNFFYLELEHRKHSENVTQPIRIAYIDAPLIINIEFILYQWYQKNLSPDLLLSNLLQQLIYDTNNEGILYMYNFNFLYQKLINDAKFFPEQFQASVNSPNGQIFMIALAIALTFKSNDRPLPNERFSLLQILNNKIEIERLLSYLTDNVVSINENTYPSFNHIFKQVENVIETGASFITEQWQLQLIKICTDKLSNISWPRIQSQLLMLAERTEMVNADKHYLTHNFLYVRDNSNYYELILLSPYESILNKDKIINPARIKRVITQNAKLIYDLSGEAIAYGYKNLDLLFLLNTLQDACIPSKNVYITCSNYKSEFFYDEWANEYKPDYKINIIGNNFWIYLRAYELSIDVDFNAKKETLINAAKRAVELNEKRLKHYMCLNLKCRRHRTVLMLFLLQKKYLHKGIVTYFGRSELLPHASGDKHDKCDRGMYNSIHDYLLKIPEGEQLKEQINTLEEMRPITFDKVANSLFSEAWPLSQFIPEISIYGDIKQIDTYFEIITETHFEDSKILFITEKSLRSFIRFQFFIIIGSPYTLKYLKSIGFKTFSPYIDESYDEITDPYKRMTAIFTEITKLCQMSIDEIHTLYCNLWPVIQHNFDHFTNNMQNVFLAEYNNLMNTLIEDRVTADSQPQAV